MEPDEEICGETYDHPELIDHGDGAWECRKCGAEGHDD